MLFASMRAKIVQDAMAVWIDPPAQDELANATLTGAPNAAVGIDGAQRVLMSMQLVEGLHCQRRTVLDTEQHCQNENIACGQKGRVNALNAAAPVAMR